MAKKENKSGLYSVETKYLYTEIRCAKCHKTIFQGCSLGLTISDKDKCPYCGSEINIHEKWENR